jgi:hypothetical protein
MATVVPEKAKLLKKLKEAGFAVPDFIYVPADHFETDDTAALEAFLAKHRESFKVIARSAHPQERCFKGGTFDSLETYADVSGIRYARNKMIKLAETTKRLTILRQQKFGHAPELDMNEMGVVVMPFVDGTSVMAKQIFGHWEFGYCRDRVHRIQSEPYITRTPHDRRLVQLSKKIQECLKFRCEIEYIISGDGEIHVVQAKDISNIDTLEEVESRRSITLTGIRRIRKRRNYRERPVYVMDNKSFYINIISRCEEMLERCTQPGMGDVAPIIDAIKAYEADCESFALRHQRYAVLGLSIQDTGDLYQIASHYLDDFPEQQANCPRRCTTTSTRSIFFYPRPTPLSPRINSESVWAAMMPTVSIRSAIRFGVCTGRWTSMRRWSRSSGGWGSRPGIRWASTSMARVGIVSNRKVWYSMRSFFRSSFVRECDVTLFSEGITWLSIPKS